MTSIRSLLLRLPYSDVPRRFYRRARYVQARLAAVRSDVRQYRDATNDPARSLRYGVGALRQALQRLSLEWRAKRDAVAIEAARLPEPVRPVEPARPLMCIRVTGGIGDYIVIARFMRDLAESSEPFTFDVFCPSPAVADWVFANVPGYSRAYQEFLFWRLMRPYPLQLQINQAIAVHEDSTDWNRIGPFTRLTKALQNAIAFRREIDICIDRHPYLDNHLARKAVLMGRSREDFLHLMAGIDYGGAAFELGANGEAARQYGLPQRYITINTGFDAGFIITVRSATKCWPHAGAFVTAFKARYPDIGVIQLGGKTSTILADADVNLVGKTSLVDAAGIIGGALLHIDNEGGLVHVAACLGVRSAVVFGPTSHDYFAYAGNINLKPSSCGDCWWMIKTWMDLCPRGDAVPRCMDQQSPEAVMVAIAPAIEAALAREAAPKSEPVAKAA